MSAKKMFLVGAVLAVLNVCAFNFYWAKVSAQGINVVTDMTPGSRFLGGTTGAIGGAPLLLGTCSTGTAAVAGATTGMTAITSPAANPGSAVIWHAWVSSANTVTVKVCGVLALTPGAVAYNVRVFP